jgi:hypothetical protein
MERRGPGDLLRQFDEPEAARTNRMRQGLRVSAAGVDK